MFSTTVLKAGYQSRYIILVIVKSMASNVLFAKG